MPYIKQKERERFDYVLMNLPKIFNKGELEYCIFWLMKHYMTSHEFRYSDLHDCTYAAIHCGDEFKRLYLDVRENKARETNGDIEA